MRGNLGAILADKPVLWGAKMRTLSEENDALSDLSMLQIWSKCPILSSYPQKNASYPQV